MAQSKPSITGTAHTLPFDKLSPRGFERLCLWLVQREGFERAEHLGAAGSEQGRDIIAWREGELWAFQCKRVQRFGPQDALAEVEKVLALPPDQRPAEFVFIVTCDVSANTRQQVRNRCAGEMPCHFWSGTEFDARVKRHPDIVEEFFQATSRDVIQRIAQIFTGSTEQQRAHRNRQAMLELVKNFWVSGVLEQSLHGAVLIELGMKERADLVDHPWDMVLQTSDQPSRLLPHGTRIVDVFDTMNRALLILGEPGSGKTTMLLELARDTIDRAERDPLQPIPVVFNLSSWATRRQPIEDWLVDELNAKYSIPKRIARPWVENDDLLVLLDGLDEVRLAHREACVKAINHFRQEHGLTSLVLCSRIADYEALTTRLNLHGAIVLQPLTHQQIEEYLEGVGSGLLAVRTTLLDDTISQELAKSPLILSIMILAYRSIPAEALRSLATIDARRQCLFDIYVQRMFKRRGTDQPYSPEQTKYRLSWLAQQMVENAQTEFLIEYMQPGWLTSRAQRWVYIAVLALVSTLGVGLSGGISAGIVYGVVTAFSGGPRGGMIIGSIVGLVVGLIGARRDIRTVEVLKWSWRQLRDKLSRALLVGLGGGMGGGLVIALIVALIFYSNPDPTLRDSAATAGLSVGLGIGLGVGLFVGLILALNSGVSTAEIETRIMPNQGIRQSARNALVVGLPIGLVGGLSLGLVVRLTFALVFGLLLGLMYSQDSLTDMLSSTILGLSNGWSIRPAIGLSARLSFGLSLGLLLGLANGGVALIRHYVLRLVLWFSGYVPWNYAHFLDYAVERIFLRKVGGGYIFVHRLLQDHFASLYPDQ